MAGDDDLNIERAVRGFLTHCAHDDASNLHTTEIKKLIQSTEYPHKTNSALESLSVQILRDADVSQVFSVAWIQQVIFGLAAEWSKQPIEVLQVQDVFLGSISFHTEWARQSFGQGIIDAKRKEAIELFKLLQ